MHLKDPPLPKLGAAFTALGIALVLTVLGLLHSAVSRLDDQRRLRHRMVAERVFDEAEREISSLLQHEAERPSAAYDAEDTDPARWSPFVLGYYHRDPELHLVAAGKLGAARKQRVEDAVRRARPQLDAPTRNPASSGDSGAERGDKTATSPQSSPDVLRQLNRSVKVRERRQHDFATTFAVVSAARDTLVMERQSLDLDRREGFVIDVPALVSTIQSWVLGAQSLDDVASLSAGLSRDSAAANGYTFSHKLAAPLDSQHVSLRLSQLDDEDASSALYGLGGLLIAAAVLGLVALYRTVAVQLRFAERRNNFVAAVTHELKTPITSIRMYGEMLRDDMVKDETTRKDYYDIITAEAERLTRLINNVMEHAKLRTGQRIAHLVRRDVIDVVQEVVELMKPHIEREGFRVTLRAEQRPAMAALDSDAFKQVLFNVLDNALKYGRSDAPALEVSCAPGEGGVVVSVRDFGRGVAPHQLQTIFEPFFRGEDELTRRSQGTGIGLALVRDLVALMHGRVYGENRAPGFEVRIVLPAAERQ